MTAICAGPARWMCTVGYGHVCAPDELIDANRVSASPGSSLVATGAEVLTGSPGSAPSSSTKDERR